MPGKYNLQRFLDAQANSYANALAEIRSGKKRSHWMWYIFPQMAGLGFSETSKLYAISNLKEAEAFLQHPVLRKNLLEISGELLKLQTDNATAIFGNPDDLKLKSSMTLFAMVHDADPVFQKVLDKFFDGASDAKTLSLINR